MTVDNQQVSMMPAEKYTSPDVLAWELRHLFAGSWTCLGRLDDVLPDGATQRALVIGDIACLLLPEASTTWTNPWPVDRGTCPDQEQAETNVRRSP